MFKVTEAHIQVTFQSSHFTPHQPKNPEGTKTGRSPKDPPRKDEDAGN